MIRKASIPDIKPIIEITKACAKTMADNGIFQWNDYYPNPSAFENDIKRQELYVLEIDFKVQGCIVISTFMDAEYQPINWLTLNGNSLYIHRLAILPELQGMGYAQQLMCFAEQFAIDNNYNSIRLDTFSMNKRNQKFYELRGYKRLGDIYFPKQSEFPFHCYELVL